MARARRQIPASAQTSLEKGDLKAYFNIYGLLVEIATNHPLVLSLFQEDLYLFRVRRKRNPKHAAKLSIVALAPTDGNPLEYPPPFGPYQEMFSRRLFSTGTMVTSYSRNPITVLFSPSQKEAKAALMLDPSLLPDPLYAFCFAQPVSFWLKQKGFFFLHAGCVARGNEGILIVGAPRSGKSALTTSFLRSGYRFLSDDQPLLSLRRGNLVAYAFPRRIRLDRSVAAAFPELKLLADSSPLKRLVFHSHELWPKRLALSCRPKLLIFPRYISGKKLRLSRLSSADSFARLLENEHFLWYKDRGWNRISQEHLSLLELLARRTRAFRLDYTLKDVLNIPEFVGRILDLQRP